MTNLTEMNTTFNLPKVDADRFLHDQYLLKTQRDKGDDKNVERLVSHVCGFPNKQNAISFSDWVKNETDGLQFEWAFDKDGSHYVYFTHYGSLRFSELVRQTVRINRKSNELNGSYGGWVTDAQKTSESAENENIQHGFECECKQCNNIYYMPTGVVRITGFQMDSESLSN